MGDAVDCCVVLGAGQDVGVAFDAEDGSETTCEGEGYYVAAGAGEHVD